MATDKLGNIARSDLVVTRDETDSSTPPVDKGDINATGAAASKILAINSGNTALEWIDQTGSATSFASLSDTNITTPADASVAIYDTGTAMWRDAVLSGDVTMDDLGVVSIANGAIDVNHLSAGAGELGTRVIGVAQTAANGSEVADEIEVSIGFVTLNNVAIDFSTGWGGITPSVRVIVSPTINGPKRHTSAYVSAVTQGIVVDGLNSSECIILGTEPATGTHVKFKVKYASAGDVYVWLGTPDCSYFNIFQYATTPITATFA